MIGNDLDEFILHLNRDAMNYLKDENYSLALKTLKDADKLLKSIDSNGNTKVQAITLNNFGCFYKRINKPNVALKFLKKACEKESIEPIDNINLAGTLLNICAIYSQLGKHDFALENGCKALQLVEKCETTSPNLVSTLIIGYHNTGVEYEYLNCLKQAVECYKSAWQCAAKHLSESNSLTKSMNKNYVNALEKYEKNELRINFREQLRINGSVQTQERKAYTGRSETRKLPEINPYIKPKTVQIQRKTHKKVVSLNETATDLSKTRFLTGDRLQPMFKDNNFNGSKATREQPRGKSVQLPLNIYKIEEFPKRMNGKKEFNTQRVNKKFIETGYIKESSFDDDSNEYRTSTAPVSFDIGNLKERIKNLENQYDDFDIKVKDIRDKLPDLLNNKLSPFGEVEKIALKKNKKDKKKEKKNGKIPKIKKSENIEKFYENIENFDENIENFYENVEKTDKIIEKNDENIDLSNNKPLYVPDEKLISTLDNEVNELIGSKENEETKILKTTQSVFRSYLERKKMNIYHEAAVMIQKHIRRYQCKTLFNTIKHAIICIQSLYRGHAVRRKLRNSI